jgi:hypothetical protein
MKKLFMKICGYIRKLRSSQPTTTPTLKAMSVKISLDCVCPEDNMDYYEWMQYLHDEIEKDEWAKWAEKIKNYSYVK